MAMRPADGRNPDKTKLQAQTSKEKVALAKVAQMTEWKQKLSKQGRKIDKNLEDAGKLAKKIGEMMKKKEDTKKALEDLGDLIQGTLQELKTFQEVPVSGHVPKVPTNTLALASMLPVLVALMAYWKAVKSKIK